MMKKPITIILLSLIVATLLLTYITIGPPLSANAIRVVSPPSIIASLPMWVAEKEEIFAKHGITIKPIDVTNSKLMVATMLAGNADVLPAVSLADLSTIGIQGQLPLLRTKIFSHSRMKMQPSFEAILVPTGSHLSGIKNLEGKRIAVYPGMTSALAVSYFLASSGVDVSNIVFVDLSPPEHEPALLRDDVQAIHVYEPFRTASLENGKTRELHGSIYAAMQAPSASPSAIGVSAISRDFFSNSPQLAERFFAAWDEAILFIRNNPKRARAILADELGLTEAIAEKATWVDATTTYETDFQIIADTVVAAQNADIIPKEFILERDMVYRR
jgi:ABC-type nitrate/sulfonate/bicarbonate transport system substrate-binding protein